MTILHELFFALWFFLPAGIANMMPIFAARWPVMKTWDAPIDFGKTYRGHRVFGTHKTWRGLIVGIVFATLTLALQVWLVREVPFLADVTDQVDYSTLPILVLGPLFGFGALAGDCIESFFKRQRGTSPGDGWFPFDQTDYIIGGALATMPFVTLSIPQYLTLIVIWLVVHVVASYIGYTLGVKEKPI
ncbi:CDP-archaeol synthase [Candidatus Saccharibacteria bacterium]|nr:CDP-archaeol synthase [Candidatus Saccharibacteria bacterium]